MIGYALVRRTALSDASPHSAARSDRVPMPVAAGSSLAWATRTGATPVLRIGFLTMKRDELAEKILWTWKHITHEIGDDHHQFIEAVEERIGRRHRHAAHRNLVERALFGLGYGHMSLMRQTEKGGSIGSSSAVTETRPEAERRLDRASDTDDAGAPGRWNNTPAESLGRQESEKARRLDPNFRPGP
jgi:hypothetical protein